MKYFLFLAGILTAGLIYLAYRENSCLVRLENWPVDCRAQCLGADTVWENELSFDSSSCRVNKCICHK